jgi:hypothetical protein
MKMLGQENSYKMEMHTDMGQGHGKDMDMDMYIDTDMDMDVEIDMDIDMNMDTDKDVITSSFSHHQANFKISFQSLFRHCVPLKPPYGPSSIP